MSLLLQEGIKGRVLGGWTLYINYLPMAIWSFKKWSKRTFTALVRIEEISMSQKKEKEKKTCFSPSELQFIKYKMPLNLTHFIIYIQPTGEKTNKQTKTCQLHWHTINFCDVEVWKTVSYNQLNMVVKDLDTCLC